MLIVDGALIPARDPQVAEQSKNYRYSTNYELVIDPDTHLAVAVGRPLLGHRNDSETWAESGVKDVVGHTVATGQSMGV